ncbi:hypothetical protein [Chitinimonas sp.]|uniref:hypothetical protein n=1 Tax=Chitinimonas sp. TaxID=1934313 RepID=UPI0035AFF7B0
MPEERNLTDDDVKALARALLDELAEKSASTLGKVLLNVLWKTALLACLGMLAWGYTKGVKP